MNKPTPLIISGCCGRMGSLLVEEALKNKAHFQLVGGTEPASNGQLGTTIPGTDNLTVTDDLKALSGKGKIIIEFTTPKATLANARIAAETRTPMVIGTTGLTPDQNKELEGCAKRVPIFWSPNMSIGIVIVRRSITAISKLLFDFGLGKQTGVNISETHHSQKQDKPSGTAKALAEELVKTTGWLIKDEEIEAKREGDVIGVHSVTFNCPSEKITLSHEATDRRVFAQGALLVAQNFSRAFKKPGLYNMDDFISSITSSHEK
jgi:4-hydroxy-tetrahydrodipicolinate reductase